MVTKFVKNTNNLDKDSGGVDASPCSVGASQGLIKAIATSSQLPRISGNIPIREQTMLRARRFQPLAFIICKSVNVHKTAVDGSNFEL